MNRGLAMIFKLLDNFWLSVFVISAIAVPVMLALDCHK